MNNVRDAELYLHLNYVDTDKSTKYTTNTVPYFLEQKLCYFNPSVRETVMEGGVLFLIVDF